MKCNKNKVPMVRLGDYIEEVDERVGGRTGIVVRGINTEIGFIPTVADMSDVDTSKYKIVPLNCYACNFMHIGRDIKIPVAYNNDFAENVVSPAYYVFKIKAEKESELNPYYLNMLLTRSEFGRLTWFYTDSSVRGNLPEEHFLDIQIPLPDIEVQKSVVAAYKGLKNLIETNETLIEPLQNACNAYVVDLKKKYPMKALGPYIQECDERNRDGLNLEFCGINKDKTFIPSVADTDGLDNSKYKVVKKGMFVFSGMQTGRDICIRIALYEEEKTCLVSPAYTTFFVNKQNEILSEYLFLYFKRYEMDRYGAFLSDGSIRSNLDWNRFLEIKIPLPPIEIQKAIVAVYKGLAEAKRIASEAKEELKKICPALVQMAAHSA